MLALLYGRGASVKGTAVSQAHGVSLPASAKNFQQIRMGWFIDRGILAVFEIPSADWKSFEAQLNINSRWRPRGSDGNPLEADFGVWPDNSDTFVPGNMPIRRLKKTWPERAEPLEALSCKSPVGDWLRVERWAIGDRSLVKLYTDWN